MKDETFLKQPLGQCNVYDLARAILLKKKGEEEKKELEFPIVFKGLSWSFEVDEDGWIGIKGKDNNTSSFVNINQPESFEALDAAIKKSKELRGD